MATPSAPPTTLLRIRRAEPELYQALEQSYAHPPRAYHHLGHVADVLTLAAEAPRYRNWPAVELAILFHDAVYEAGAADNERRSADLCRALVPEVAEARAPHVDQACALILLTARHAQLARAELTDDARHFLDADLAILGADAARFRAYDDAIRSEHAHLDDVTYTLGRAAFLKRMLALPSIFMSDAFYQRYEQRARANLLDALAQLDT
jgi:predicted metal-dependent HD superfamily phosphohydrolase